MPAPQQKDRPKVRGPTDMDLRTLMVIDQIAADAANTAAARYELEQWRRSIGAPLVSWHVRRLLRRRALGEHVQ